MVTMYWPGRYFLQTNSLERNVFFFSFYKKGWAYKQDQFIYSVLSSIVWLLRASLFIRREIALCLLSGSYRYSSRWKSCNSSLHYCLILFLCEEDWRSSPCMCQCKKKKCAGSKFVLFSVACKAGAQ